MTAWRRSCRDHEIDYIKWDHNRVLPMPDAAQTRGSYALIDRLRADFPGGRDRKLCLGRRAHRLRHPAAAPSGSGCRDSNDALERLRIQHDAALFLPLAVTGSHVGPRHCHTSGRVLDISFRAWVAAQRHMGFEMDPRELTDARGGRPDARSPPGGKPTATGCARPISCASTAPTRR